MSEAQNPSTTESPAPDLSSTPDWKNFSPRESSRFSVHPVKTEQDAKDFLMISVSLYKGDPSYIRPLDDDINNIFNPKKNKFFRHGEAERWLLKDQQGKVVGRIAAFINEKTKMASKIPTGGMGFFECIDDEEAVHLLLDTAKAWNLERGMEAIEGPINFGERQQWWGLLVEGFDPPAYQMNYNHKYYQKHIESYGFRDYFQQYTYGMKVHDPRPEKYYARSERLAKDPDYTFRHVEMDKLDKYAEDFRQIFNGAFAMHAGRQMSSAAAKKLMQSMKPIIVDYIMWFGYHKERPIAFFINIPDINQYFKHVNGKMNLWGKIKFFYHSKINRTVKKFIGIVFGVVKDYQGKGVEGAIVIAAHNKIAPTMKWFDIELQWIGDFNPKMNKVAENLGAHIIRRHITYRLIFNPEVPFTRHPVI